MTLKDSLPEFRELRMFAMEEIPIILREEGGTVEKLGLHRRVEERFSHLRGGWPQELDGPGRSGCRRATNAIAWALATLTSQEVIDPCLGVSIVRLRSADGDRTPRDARERTLRASSRRDRRIEAHVRARAVQAISRARKAKLAFDKGFVEDSVIAVRQAQYRCEITGHAFAIDYRTAGAGGTEYAPSPERLVPERGYVRGNVRWVLSRLNRSEGETLAEHHPDVLRLAANSATKAEHGRNGFRTAGSNTTVLRDRGTQDGYTVQQIAAFKAHITMLRRSLPGLKGNALTAAVQKLARWEERLAAASSAEDD
jgi:hypothetical protein